MARMTQAALGIGCLAGGAPVLHAAQWSFSPQASIWVDDDSNRYLGIDARASQSAYVNPSAVFQWSSDTSQLSLTPWLMWQQISDSAYADVHSESLNGQYNWTGELGQLTLQGGFADYSTLATQLPDTGLVAPGVNRRTKQGSLFFSHLQTERRSLILQMSWMDLGYYGPNSEYVNLLAGYKYATVSVGEMFNLTPQTSLTPTLFDNQVITALSYGKSRESGLRLDFQHSFTERTSVKAYVGASQQSSQTVVQTLVLVDGGLALQDSLHPTSRIGALGGFTLSLATLRGHLDLDYANSLQPYSGGVVAQRQALTLSDTQSVSDKVDVRVSAARIQNSHSAVVLDIDRAFYDTATLGVDWHFAESWRLHSEVGVTHTDTLTFATAAVAQPITEWRIALSVSWMPLPTQRTF
jgi:hypothetical protein